MDQTCLFSLLVVLAAGMVDALTQSMQERDGYSFDEWDAPDSPVNARTAAWAAAAYDVLQTVACERQRWTTEASCRAAQAVPRHLTRMWATQAGSGPYLAWVPDGRVWAGMDGVEGVVVLDLHPHASWAHLVLLLLVYPSHRQHCSGPGTHWLASGDCLRIGVKERCRNLLENGALGGDDVARRCETNMLPLVIRQRDDPALHTRNATPPQHSTVPHTTPHHSTVPHTTPHHSTVPHTTPRHSTVPHTTPHHSTVPHTTPHHSTVPHTAPHQTPLLNTTQDSVLLGEDLTSSKEYFSPPEVNSISSLEITTPQEHGITGSKTPVYEKEILGASLNSTQATITTTTRPHLRQRLLCRDAPGYLSCPVLRPLEDTTHLVCDPLEKNRQSCREPVQTRCRVLEACDQGVVVVGAWRREVSPRHTAATVHAAYRLLTRYGFLKSNIKIFYANGARRDEYPAEGQGVYPSSMKLALRYHLRTVCSAPICTDSLLLYLAGPALPDGTILLWDHDGDGRAAAGEIYTPRELASDLSGCTARQVTLLVDTSYSGQLIRVFNSTKHANVQVYTAGGSDEYSWGREFSGHWLHYPHAHTCTAAVHQEYVNTNNQSTPMHFDGSDGRIQSTIFGAPCNVTPPYTHRELHRRYLGCQNTPAALWLRAHIHPFTRPDPALITNDQQLPFHS